MESYIEEQLEWALEKQKENRMNFKEAYQKMLEGKKIARPCFKGYWFIDGVTNKLTIHLASGEEITEGALDHAVRNSLAYDWQVVE